MGFYDSSQPLFPTSAAQFLATQFGLDESFNLKVGVANALASQAPCFTLTLAPSRFWPGLAPIPTRSTFHHSRLSNDRRFLLRFLPRNMRHLSRIGFLSEHGGSSVPTISSGTAVSNFKLRFLPQSPLEHYSNGFSLLKKRDSIPPSVTL